MLSSEWAVMQTPRRSCESKSIAGSGLTNGVIWMVLPHKYRCMESFTTTNPFYVISMTKRDAERSLKSTTVCSAWRNSAPCSQPFQAGECGLSSCRRMNWRSSLISSSKIRQTDHTAVETEFKARLSALKRSRRCSPEKLLCTAVRIASAYQNLLALSHFGLYSSQYGKHQQQNI